MFVSILITMMDIHMNAFEQELRIIEIRFTKFFTENNMNPISYISCHPSEKHGMVIHLFNESVKPDLPAEIKNSILDVLSRMKYLKNTTH